MIGDRRAVSTGTPAAMFVGVVLGLCSIGGLVWSINRTITREHVRLDHWAVEPPTQAGLEQRSDLGEPSVAIDRAFSKPSQLGVVHLVDLNAASAAQLELLPRIGPALAGRIVVDRRANGWFDSIDDLERVRGIGPKTVEKIRAFAMIGERDKRASD